jgi:hypothetical protein
MLRSSRKFASKFDALSRLGVDDMFYGRIDPPQVRTMFSAPVQIVPTIPDSILGQGEQPSTSLFYYPTRLFVWKPKGLYSGAPGALTLFFSNGVAVVGFSVTYTAVLTASQPDCRIYTQSAAYNQFDCGFLKLGFSGADVTGAGPALYYALFCKKVPLSVPFQL